MASTTGTTDHPVSGAPAAPPAQRSARPSLLDDLLRHPRRYTFFQALRILERYCGGEPIGRAGLPRREAIRLRAHAALSFPAWDLEEAEELPNPWRQPETRYRLTVTFMGVYGPASPLPANYTELLIRPEDDETDEDRERVRDFIDLFHHRKLSFVYRCMAKYRYHLLFEPGARDHFSRYMLSLFGRGTRGLEGWNRPVHPERLIRYAGLLMQQPRCAAGLESLLRDFLRLKISVQQCVGRWLRVEDRNQLGGAFCALGQDLVVGSSIYDRAGKIRISVGPVGFAKFKDFLPSGKLTGQLRELVRMYLVDELEFDLEVWLKGDEIPPLQMGGGPDAAMLGWTSWAVTGPSPDRAVVFSCQAP
ncbi:MAG TPA: type VI secretion system baseplate subunit TssG [Candidatus Sumerlaeota bacterium]|nr:MAG: hypothetical protein BWZ08_01327 [candidate division BRC1 bacterium ADurb.BinA292]HPK03223.1 type VI secretion system baseplate subunit TssG [Candidatus Sumerlaeota bacterium]